MKKHILLIAILFSFSLVAQNGNWQLKNKTELSSLAKIEKTSSVKNQLFFGLNMNALKSQLNNALLRGSSTDSQVIVAFPNSKGVFSNFTIYEAPVLHPDLGQLFPEIKSYVGISLEDKSTVIRFSLTLFGFHAIIFSSEGTTLIEPYSTDLQNYMVYAKSEAQTDKTFECLVNDVNQINTTGRTENSVLSNSGLFRTYRLALACTVEYAAFHINQAGLNGGTLAQRQLAVLSAMTVTMTRVNGVFEKDLSITTQIIAGNLPIIFLLPENPDTLTNNSGGALINEIQPIVDNGVGAANYDIGHVFSTGGGGIAQLFSPCSNNKARGVTGSGAPVGDPFDIDYVAHEMGHQFGANHTQNNSCQRNTATAVEPGSASTIMGYAGICAPNVQNNSDAHFHAVSIAEMDGFISGSGNCAASVPNFNDAPVLPALENYIIPISTPFVLDATATDANGDALTYCWEQTNNQVSTQPPVAGSPSGPNFRSNSPTTASARYFPSLATVLTGATANTWEVVPSVGRTMNFALTVRDNRVPLGGQTAREDMTVTTTASAGPFIMTAPNTNVNWTAGSNREVTWNVAGTDANGVNCENVDIYLSVNGGATFPILLASNVPNDGSETVSIPNIIGTTNRIMVKGNKNIFFDVSNTNFSITNGGNTFAVAFDGQIDGQNKPVCQGNDVVYNFNYSTIGTFSGTTTFSATGNPPGTNITFSPPSSTTSQSVTMTVTNTDAVSPGIYQIAVTGTSGTTTKTVNFYLEILNATFSVMTLTSPTDQAFAQIVPVPLQWAADAAATNYDVEIATDIDFTNIIVSESVATNSYTASTLADNSNYFWRVLPRNSQCQGDFSEAFRFTTGQNPCSIYNSSNVPVTISASGTPTVTSTLTIPAANNIVINKVTVSLNISHTWLSDLTVTLISPSPASTEIVLFSNECGNNNNAVATFDDDGVTLTCSGTPSISGTLIPQNPLSGLIGQASQGDWTLRVSDSANQDGGSINSWSLTLCQDVVNAELPCGVISSTWNGTSWSNGFPVNNVSAIISDDLVLSRDMEACSLDITGTAQVTLANGNNVIIKDAVTVGNNASFTVENNANLIQLSENSNTGTVKVQRNTNSLMRLDYSMWSSPVTGTQTLLDFSPETLTNRFYNYITQSNIYTALSNPDAQGFDTAKGYLIRIADNHPTTPSIWSGEFIGTPNNGAIETNLEYFSASQGFNLIGNPYPSTISAEDFLANNSTDINGVLYFWRKTNNAAGTAYATYTLGGATTTSPTSPTPNGTIQVGQGFIVSARSVTNPKAVFTNDMRVDNNNNQFFRVNFGLPISSRITLERHRIWLNLTNTSGLFSQMMVGYISGASNGFDDFIDGKYIGDNNTSLTSIINNERYSIQGKSLPFEATDIVPLQFETASAGIFTIALDAVDGLFETDQPIYLRDNLTNSIQNLKEASYTFNTEEGIFTNRFEVVYQNVLSTSDATFTNQVFAFISNQQLNIKSTSATIDKVIVYDMLGRQLSYNEKVNSQTFSIFELVPQSQALIIKVVLENGMVEIRKIIF